MAEIGHGDEIILADAHFRAHTFTPKVLRADGFSLSQRIPIILRAFLL